METAISNKNNQTPFHIEQMLSAAGDESLRGKVKQFYDDPERGAQYDAMMPEFLAELPGYRVTGLADACYSYIRAWESGGGKQIVARCIVDACTTDYPRVLAFNMYRAQHLQGIDKTEAYCLIKSIFDNALPVAMDAA